MTDEIREILLKEVKSLYDWLDAENEKACNQDTCNQCGQCCEYETFGHEIYITSLEVLYLKEHLPPGELKSAMAGRCPYQANNICTIRELRFGPCRIFFCKGDNEQQNLLAEKFLSQIKQLCRKYDYPYRYEPLSKALQ